MITTVVLPIVAVLVLVLVNGLFVAAEFALVGARRSRVQTLADSGSRAARWLLGVFDRPTGKDGYIAIAQLGITLASIGLGMYGEPAVAGWLYEPLEDAGLSYGASHAAGFAIALSAITFLHVVFGEMIPKALALQAPESVVVRVNPAMRAFGLVFRPMVAVLNATALGLMRLLRIPEPDKSHALYTSAELAIVTDEAADSGQLGAQQRDLIRNIFDLEERRAEELMTSRGRLECSTWGRAPTRWRPGSRPRRGAATRSSTVTSTTWSACCTSRTSSGRRAGVRSSSPTSSAPSRRWRPRPAPSSSWSASSAPAPTPASWWTSSGGPSAW